MTARDSAFRRKQGIVIAQGVVAVLVGVLVGMRARTLFAALVPESDDSASRLPTHWFAALVN